MSWGYNFLSLADFFIAQDKAKVKLEVIISK